MNNRLGDGFIYLSDNWYNRQKLLIDCYFNLCLIPDDNKLVTIDSFFCIDIFREILNILYFTFVDFLNQVATSEPKF